jgi:hypothetical protein
MNDAHMHIGSRLTPGSVQELCLGVLPWLPNPIPYVPLVNLGRPIGDLIKPILDISLRHIMPPVTELAQMEWRLDALVDL